MLPGLGLECWQAVAVQADAMPVWGLGFRNSPLLAMKRFIQFLMVRFGKASKWKQPCLLRTAMTPEYLGLLMDWMVMWQEGEMKHSQVYLLNQIFDSFYSFLLGAGNVTAGPSEGARRKNFPFLEVQ